VKIELVFFKRGHFVKSSSPSWGTDLLHIPRGYRTFIEVSNIKIVLQYVVPFQNHSAPKSTRVENLAKYCMFDPIQN